MFFCKTNHDNKTFRFQGCLSSKIKWLLPIALLLLIIFWGLSQSKNDTSSKMPSLWVEGDNLNFGEVQESDSFRWKIPIKNISPKAIKVSRIIASCSCTSISPSSFVLAPGQKIDLKINMNLIGIYGITPPHFSRLFETRIVPIFESNPPEKIIWTLKGKVLSAFRVSNTNISFLGPDAVVRGTKTKPRQIVVNSRVPLKKLAVEHDKQLLEVQVLPDHSDLSQFNIVISPLATLPTGTFNTSVLLRGIELDGDECFSLPISVSGIVEGDVRLVPNTIHFGVQKVGKVSEAVIAVESRTGQTFTVETVETNTNEVTCNFVPKKDCKYQEILISKKLSTLGNHRDTIIVQARHNDGSYETLKANICVYVCK